MLKSYSTLALSLFPLLALSQTIVLQAENGTLSGNVKVDTSVPGYSGAGFVSGFQASADSVSVNFTVPKTALYDLTVAYNAPFGYKQANVLLNGSPSGAVTFDQATWTNASAGQVLLNAGVNSIGILDDWGWYYVDAFYLTPATPPPPHQAHNPPVNKHATLEARSLLKYIQKHYANSSSLISGQQAGTYLSGDTSTDAISWVKKNVGKTPAMGGFDFIDYSPSRVAFGTTSNNTEQAFAWDKRNGIVAFAWHWNAPTDLINSDTEPWWSGFYTAATTFNVSAALAQGPNGTDYKLLLRDIDAIAVQLKRLQSKRIPILFRFLHEADGGWFWWGAQGPEAAVKLYRLGYDRLTNYHKINNIIWVWNSATPSWYPGDDVVDILSYDSYPAAGDHGPVSGVFDGLVTLGKDKKVVALAEVGGIPDPNLLVAYYANWAYFMTWTGDFIDDGVQNSLSFLKQLYNNPNVITLETPKNFKYLL